MKETENKGHTNVVKDCLKEKKKRLHSANEKDLVFQNTFEKFRIHVDKHLQLLSTTKSRK